MTRFSAADELADCCEKVARIVWGDPSSETDDELRWGSRGARVVNRKKHTWFNHEENCGGGTLKLVPGATKAERLQWLRDRGLIKPAPKIVKTYNYDDADGALSFQVVRLEPKDFRQRRPDGNGGWIWNLKGVRRVPYRLPELIAAVARGETIYVVEGEKDAESLRALGFTATCNPGGVGKWRSDFNQFFKGADVVVIADNDEPGRKHVAQVAAALHGIAARLRVLDLAAVWREVPEKGDISNWLEAGVGSRENLLEIVATTPAWIGNGATPPPRHETVEERHGNGDDRGDEDKIAALAELSSIAYHRRRVQAAQDLGITVGALDKLVRQRRVKTEEESAALPHWVVEPWGDPVDSAALLDAIEAMFRRYIVLPEGAAQALALWTLHAWTFDAGDISPFLVLISPTKRCGKTNTLIVLLYLTPRSELASNISPSALFRSIEVDRPTLLIDEADSFLKDNEEMRGILNGGHTKAAAYVKRNVEVNGEHKPRRFSTWAPKAIATIRALADTLEDRSIVIQLQRKPKSAKVERLRRRDSEEFAALRRQAARWAADNFSKLTDPDPQIPDALNDRAADNWRPLIAIADLVGGMWPERARRAACTLSGDDHDTSPYVGLLADIRQAFGDDEAMRSVDLVAALVKDPERPWAEWRRGKPLTQKQLGALLRPFGISSETVTIPGLNDAKGYKRVRFEAAWASYLPGQNTPAGSFQPSEASKRRNADEMGTTRDFQSVAATSGDGSKNDDLSYSHAGSDASTLRKPGNGAQGEFDHAAARADDCCAHCGQPGALQRVALSDRPGIVPLHRECEQPWLSGNTGIAFMITNAMRGKLRERGYSDADILDLTPQQAHDILRQHDA